MTTVIRNNKHPLRACARLLALSFVVFSGCLAQRGQKAVPGNAAGSKNTAAADSASAKQAQRDNAATRVGAATAATAAAQLTTASQLMIKACDNYLSVNPESPKLPEVMSIKASIYYNNKQFAKSRETYMQVIEKFANTAQAFESVRMIAQAFYEEKRFDEAQEWYRKLRDIAGDGTDKQEAVAKIAESVFRMAETAEEQSRFKEAAEQYERVALEFPESKIADVALYNAGLAYEKQTEWSHAILVFQRLIQRYPTSKLLPKTMFRTAKSHEKLFQWDNAAEMYLRLTASYPRSEHASAALYNAGLCFENAEKLPEAAATFEKMAQLYPAADEAADVLFRAGEIYGKLKDWESVSRVNQAFSLRYGNDANRAIQALCMVGVAFYMQNKEKEAIEQLNRAVATFGRIKEPSAVNAYYAAKAQFTIGEIYHGMMTRVVLGQPRNQYKRQLKDKSDLLDETVNAYTRVIKFSISEWTTRSICLIGQTYEDFGLGIFKQGRAPDMSIEERIGLELGIAQAVEKYFVEKANHYHEQNVKLGIKEKIEDKFILQSRRKLTYLPYVAAENYLALSEIARNAEGNQKVDGFALIARKLQILQKIGPYQERAIDLLLKALELGATYQELDEFYKKASGLITRISFNVAETYADVVVIAREAPIPETFDDYERFVYKTKLLKQIEGYEDQALTNYLKTLKIAQAYAITDESVSQTRERVAQILFTRGRCYDLLCTSAFSHPPYPRSISEAEKDEYRARFEEIGLRFQEQAFEIYKTVLEFAKQNSASGEYVTHAFVRLFQNFPETYGQKENRIVETAIVSGPQWRCTADTQGAWYDIDFDDQHWEKAHKANLKESQIPSGFPGNPPVPMWLGTGSPGDTANYKPHRQIFLRRTFDLSEIPHSAAFYLAGGEASVYLNGTALPPDSGSAVSGTLRKWNFMGKIRQGKNVLALRVINDNTAQWGVLPMLHMTVSTEVFVAKPPGTAETMTPEQVRTDKYRFPFVKNFSVEEKGVMR